MKGRESFVQGETRGGVFPLKGEARDLGGNPGSREMGASQEGASSVNPGSPQSGCKVPWVSTSDWAFGENRA